MKLKPNLDSETSQFALQIYESFFNEICDTLEENVVSYIFDSYENLIKSLDTHTYKDFLKNTETLEV